MTAVTGILCALEDFAAVFGLLSVFHFLLQKELRLTKPRVAVSVLLLLLPTVTVLLFPALPEPFDGLPDLLANVVYVVTVCLLVQHPRPLTILWQTIFYTFTVEVFWGLIAFYTSQALWLEYVVCTVLYLLTGGGICLLARRAGGNRLPWLVAATPKWTYAVLLVFEVMCYYKAYGEEAAFFDLAFLFSSGALIVTVLYLLFRIVRLSHEEAALMQQMTLQKEYAEAAITDDEELRRFRHDYKNHMLVVQTLLESGKTEDARKYIAAVQEPVNAAMQKVKTGNFVADTILNHKASIAADAQIVLHFTGRIPTDGIRSDDLCTIFSNLLDNAVEACRAQNGRQDIFVEAKTSAGTFLLSVSNPTGAAANITRRTTKADKRNHGFGLKNVERAAKKYGGTLQTDIQNGMFCADVLLKLPKATVTAE